MFRKNFITTFIYLILLIGCFASGVLGAEILFVTSNADNPGNDGLIKNRLEWLGHTVTYIDDNASEAETEAAALSADLVFISESVSSGEIKNEITEIAVPMIVAEPYAWDEMGLTIGGGGDAGAVSTDITIVNSDHFLAAGLNGDVTVLDGLMGSEGAAKLPVGLAGSQATVIATATLEDGETYDILYVYDKGARLAAAPADGSSQVAADIRICLFFHYTVIDLLNDNAYRLLDAAVNYALGQTDTGVNILLITDNPADPGSDELVKSFLEDQGHTVTYFDAHNAEAEMEAAALAADVVYIAESVGSGDVKNKITEIATPMIIGEPYAWDEMGLISDTGGVGDVASTDITIVNPDHYLAAGFTGEVTILTTASGATFGRGTLGSEATVIAQATLNDGVTYDIFFVYEEGATLAQAPADGSPQIAAEMRIGIFHPEPTLALLNDNGNALLAAAVNYATGRTSKAYNPRPANGDTSANPSQLKWAPGQDAQLHNVYLGLSSDVPELVGDGQTETTYQPTEPFTPGFMYYWRVDEVKADGTIQIGDLWNFTVTLLTAVNPSPADDAVFVDLDTDLSWVSGLGAVAHDVYFGVDAAAVANATKDSPEFMDSVSGSTYEPGPLAKGMTYYWRVDAVQVDGTVQTGSLWNFSTPPEIQVSDPNLIGWWKMDDEGVGVVIDYSSFDNHGTILGDPQWVQGVDGDALDFDGVGDQVETYRLPSELGLAGNVPRSVTVWVFTRSFNDGGIFEMGSHNDGEDFGLRTRTTLNTWRVQYWNVDYDFIFETENEWVHFTHVHDGAETRIYANGELIVTHPITLNTTDGKTFKIGSYRADRFDGMIDDFRLYDRVVDESEITDIMAGDPTLARRPEPASHSIIDIVSANSLSWSPGDGAVEHDVYFGTDREAVDNADTSVADIYRGRQDFNSYTPPEGFEWDQTYYWRIDEVRADATISKGHVWTLTIGDFLVVEGFETYSDYTPDEVWNTWIDGYDIPTNGSSAGYPDPDFVAGEHYLDNDIVHSGEWSMPLFYDNSAGISEVTRIFISTMRDWTREGVGVLTLFYYGVADNDPEQMYVALNGNAVVNNDNPNAALVEEWIRWDIPLQRFADLGVNPGNVDSMTIGFGNKSNPTVGGAGHVFFDDIRLYRP